MEGHDNITSNALKPMRCCSSAAFARKAADAHRVPKYQKDRRRAVNFFRAFMTKKARKGNCQPAT
jgi:hypothetical protein